jgi:hypothetical protein
MGLFQASYLIAPLTLTKTHISHFLAPQIMAGYNDPAYLAMHSILLELEGSLGNLNTTESAESWVTFFSRYMVCKYVFFITIVV